MADGITLFAKPLVGVPFELLFSPSLFSSLCVFASFNFLLPTLFFTLSVNYGAMILTKCRTWVVPPLMEFQSLPFPFSFFCGSFSEAFFSGSCSPFSAVSYFADQFVFSFKLEQHIFIRIFH